MDVIHLSDFDIQQLAETETVHPHIASCQACAGKLTFYKTLAAEIETASDFKLPAAFEIRVMSKLYEQPTGIWSDWEQLFTILFTIIGSVIAVTFLAGLPLFDSIRNQFAVWSNTVTSVVPSSGYLPYALVPVLLGIIVIDRLLKKHFRTSH